MSNPHPDDTLSMLTVRLSALENKPAWATSTITTTEAPRGKGPTFDDNATIDTLHNLGRTKEKAKKK